MFYSEWKVRIGDGLEPSPSRAEAGIPCPQSGPGSLANAVKLSNRTKQTLLVMSRALWRLPRATRGYSTAAADESVLRGWLDRNAARPVQKTLSRLEAEQCTLLSTTLHDNARDFAPGDVLPPMWHIIFGNARYTLKQLGPDGHGADIHPPGFNRRMWAGGRMLFNTANPPRLNADHTFSLSYSPDYKIRAGKRGPMVFVEEIREVANAEGWCVREKRDVVYLSAGPPEAKTEKKDAAPKAEKPKADKPAPEPAQADFTRVVVPNETMLFRFSALTWNSHRIHYDFPVCLADLLRDWWFLFQYLTYCLS